MATTFTGGTSSLMGPIKSAFQTATKVAGKPEPDEGFVWRREYYTADLYRYGKTLTSFLSLAGNRVAADTLSTTNGGDTLAASGDPYMVVANDMNPDPVGSGIWKETLIAIRYGEWEQWETNPS
jgi:hypothetical protein